MSLIAIFALWQLFASPDILQQFKATPELQPNRALRDTNRRFRAAILAAEAARGSSGQHSPTDHARTLETPIAHDEA